MGALEYGVREHHGCQEQGLPLLLRGLCISLLMGIAALAVCSLSGVPGVYSVAPDDFDRRSGRLALLELDQSHNAQRGGGYVRNVYGVRCRAFSQPMIGQFSPFITSPEAINGPIILPSLFLAEFSCINMKCRYNLGVLCSNRRIWQWLC